MAVLSVLRSGLKQKFLLPNQRQVLQISKREGHDRIMYILPSHFQWNKFKDLLHFYILIGIVPVTLISMYCNFFIGEAELAEIPEGYEPYIWEYEKHPINRFLARYYVYDHRVAYEEMCHYMNLEAERLLLGKTEDTVKAMMSKRNDYQAWFYRPVWGQYHRQQRERFRWMIDQDVGPTNYRKEAEKVHPKIFFPHIGGDPAPPAE